MSAEVLDYTVDELMIAVLASCFQNEDQVCNGMASVLPVCAIQLARLTHAPELLWVAGAAGVDPPIDVPLGASSIEAPLWRDAVMYMDPGTQFWDYVANPRFMHTFCVGAAQLDAHGNANNSVVGPFHRPVVRLPGTAGLGDMGSLPKRLIYWISDHSTRTLVERVDFRSAIGYLDGHGARSRLGIAGGPELVVTNLAVFDFDPESERMRLQSIHPGVDLDAVLEATGFTPVLPAHLSVTATPTPEEVVLIRHRIDPHGWRKREFRR